VFNGSKSIFTIVCVDLHLARLGRSCSDISDYVVFSMLAGSVLGSVLI
jgi:hypothetical protein